MSRAVQIRNRGVNGAWDVTTQAMRRSSKPKPMDDKTNTTAQRTSVQRLCVRLFSGDVRFIGCDVQLGPGCRTRLCGCSLHRKIRPHGAILMCESDVCCQVSLGCGTFSSPEEIYLNPPCLALCSGFFFFVFVQRYWV
jgi:hypothetical protein